MDASHVDRIHCDHSISSSFLANHALNACGDEQKESRKCDQHIDESFANVSHQKSYDYVLKFLLVGDSDVGKEEILNGCDDDISVVEPQYCGSPGVGYKSTVILLDGKRIRLQLWDTSGQGRFSTIIRSYSRGAQGILLVYDITNKWSFAGLNRWLQEIEEHAPGVPKILVGNRLHLAFKRQVAEYSAENYAQKHNMAFFEVSPLCNYNVRESFAELSRMVLQRHGMENILRHNTVLSLQELCCRIIIERTTVYGVEQLPLPSSLKSWLKSYSRSQLSNYILKQSHRHYHNSHKANKDSNNTLKKKAKALFNCDNNPSSHSINSFTRNSRNNHRHRSCIIS
ncbi:Ras-related protein Rab-40C-like protein [Dinothrombium tinctorium]|uniref:Ras-related protein Rab-40C-like protein n=1 Tax=Dinothrombium tinctorium TaxID=1965070 RepID=A0A443R8F0_9ACAR|nr:Ras-related protein Rab-40C-like protein [Dinothrombium tinctorium]